MKQTKLIKLYYGHPRSHFEASAVEYGHQLLGKAP